MDNNICFICFLFKDDSGGTSASHKFNFVIVDNCYIHTLS